MDYSDKSQINTDSELLKLFLVFSFFVFFASCAVPLKRNPSSGDHASRHEKPLDQAWQKDSSQDPTGPGRNGEDGGIPSGTPVIQDDTPDRKNRPLKTNFYAGELIREKYTDGPVEKVRIILRGNATIVHGTIRIVAPVIVLEDGKSGRITGGVTVIDRENGIRLRAGRAVYSRDDQRIVMDRRPVIHIVRKGSDPATVTTDRIEQDLAEKTSTLKGDVRIFQRGIALLSEEGVYDSKRSVFELKDEPIAIGPGNYMTGKKLEYDSDRKHLEVRQNVSFFFRQKKSLEPEQKQTEQSEVPSLIRFAKTDGRLFETAGNASVPGEASPASSKSTDRILTADALSYQLKSNDQEPTMRLIGNVLLTGDKIRLKSPEIETEGSSMNILVARNGAELFDGKQHIRATGKIMKYDREQETLRLEKDSLIEFLDDLNEQVTGELQAAFIEANLKTEKTFARGDVRLKRDDYIATGEIARYEASSDVVIVEGNPGIERNGSKVRSERIFIYPEQSRVLLLDGISGSLSGGE